MKQRRYMAWILITLFCYVLPLNAEVLKDYKAYVLLERRLTEEREGTLLMSDSPELVHHTGILYQDQLEGKGRLLYHHVNMSYHTQWHLMIIAENVSDKEVILTVDRGYFADPTNKFLYTGQQVLKQYFEANVGSTYIIPQSEKIVLYDSKGKLWRKGHLCTGMADIETTGSVKITFVIAPPLTTIDEALSLPCLERDNEPRGTFYTLERDYTMILPKTGKGYTLLGNREEWAYGNDGILNEITTNEGNYGIVYCIKMIALADTNVIACPRGGIFQGIVRWDDGTLVPIERTHFFKEKQEVVPLGTLKKGEVRKLYYMLPNGSAAPVLLGFEAS